MKTLGNVLWFIIIGLWSSLYWLFIGILWGITIIGIPFSIQCFKFARLSALPFGTEVKTHFGKHPIANIIWIMLFGWELTLGYVAFGIILFFTIIGIPFSKQCFKLASLALTPFGAKIT